MKGSTSVVLTALLVCTSPIHAARAASGGDSHYSEEKIYQARPDPGRDTPFGWIGTTGLMVRVYPGVTLKVEGMMPGSPAEGKFSKGETITSINGITLKGLDPFVTLGDALTKAEAGDGETSLGALRFFYRFAGRGTVPYGEITAAKADSAPTARKSPPMFHFTPSAAPITNPPRISTPCRVKRC